MHHPPPSGSFSSATQPDTPGRATLPQWEDTTRRGLACAGEGRWSAAQQLHELAVDIARTLLAGEEAAARPDDCLAAFVVAHLNLADALSALGQPRGAAGRLCTAHHALRALVHDESATSALRQSAWRQRRETHAALLMHLRSHGPDAAIERCLAADAEPAGPLH